MKVIGEKTNGTRKRVARAIAEQDADFVRDLPAGRRRPAHPGSTPTLATIPSKSRTIWSG